jgi:GcrA cell cycle regulator
MGWTEERVEILKKLWAEGLSAAQIAKRLEGVSRNAVIGKIHRVGPPLRDMPVRIRPSIYKRAPSERAPGSAAAADRAPQSGIRLAPMLRVVVETPGLATGATLQAHMCKWPIGHPDDTDFTFCGRSATSGRPYCAQHAHVAYRPVAGAGPGNTLPPDLSRLLARYG